MAKEKFPVTPAIRKLREAKLDYLPHLYDYEEKGGTARSAACLGVSEHEVIKTLVMEDETRAPLVVLIHGDREVSTKALARHLSKKTIVPCEPKIASKHSGYLVGGTSPLGTRKAMPIYAEASIATLERIFVNGGKRGFLVEVAPRPLLRLLDAELVECAS